MSPPKASNDDAIYHFAGNATPTPHCRSCTLNLNENILTLTYSHISLTASGIAAVINFPLVRCSSILRLS